MSYFRAFAAVAAMAAVQGVSGWEIDLPPCLTPFQPFTYSGCFASDSDAQTLVYRSNEPSQGMTLEKCVQDCKGQGYRYAGLKYYGVCFCGDTVQGTGVDESQCNLPCDGNKTETCGGNDALSVWSDPTFPASDETVIIDYVPAGCMSDNSDVGRALAHQQDIPAAQMTIAKCVASCKAGGYPFAGLEFGQECYCGPVIGNFSETLDDSSCNMPCKGDASATCGGRGALNLYVAKELQSLQPCGYVPPPVSSVTKPTISVPTSTPTYSVPTSSIISVPSSSKPTTSPTTAPTTAPSSSKPSSTPYSTSKPPSSTTAPPATTKPPTSVPTSPVPMCTATVTVPAKCEYGCGKWCADELPDFQDATNCASSFSRCKLQIADCFSNAGWPDAMQCFDFSKWCSGISTYCGANNRPGSKCSKSDCYGKNPPKNSKPAQTTTSVYPCPTTTGKPTTSSKPVPTTSTSSCPIPVVTNICKQPSSWKYNYGPGNPVGGIELPVVTCNDLKDDFNAGNQFKLYQYKDSSKCGSYSRPSCSRGNACADACKAQYTQCAATYVTACKANNGGRSRFARDAETKAIVERTWGWGWTDSQGTANSKCYTQYQDCLYENKNVDISNKCTAYGRGW